MKCHTGEIVKPLLTKAHNPEEETGKMTHICSIQKYWIFVK